MASVGSVTVSVVPVFFGRIAVVDFLIVLWCSRFGFGPDFSARSARVAAELASLRLASRYFDVLVVADLRH